MSPSLAPMLLALLLSLPAFAAKRPYWEVPPALVDGYNDAVEMLDGGDPGEARSLFEAIVEEDPRCGMARYALAQAILRQNDPAGALVVAETLVRDFSRRPEVYSVLSEARFALEDFEAAREAAQRGYDLDPGDSAALAQVVYADVRLGRYDAATAMVDDAGGSGNGGSGGAIAPADLSCLRLWIAVDLDDTAGAAALAPSCAASTAPFAGDAMMAHALLTKDFGGAAVAAAEMGAGGVVVTQQVYDLANQGRCDEAAALYGPLLARDPADATALVARAQCAILEGRWAEAEPDLVAFLSQRARVDVETTGAFTGVLTRGAEKALQQNLATAGRLLVEVQIRQGKYAAAERTLADIRVATNDTGALRAEEIGLRGAQGDLPTAWTLLGKAIADGVEAGPLAAAAARLAVADGAHVSPGIAEFVQTHGAPADRYNLAIGYANADAGPACVAVLERLHPVVTALSGEMGTGGISAGDISTGDIAALAYSCVTREGTVAETERWRALTPADKRTGASEFNYAVLLYNNGRRAEARAVVQEIRTEDATLSAQVKEFLATAR